MYPSDIAKLMNWVVSGLIGVVFGILSAWATHRLQRKRDDIAWEREKEKIQKKFENEKEMLELRFQQKLRELQYEFIRQQDSSIRDNLIKGIDDPQKTIEFYHKAMNRLREIGSRAGEAETLTNLGNAHYFLGDMEEAIQYYSLAISLQREMADIEGEASNLWNTSLAFAKLGENDLAINKAEEALQRLKIINSPHKGRLETLLAELRKQSMR